MINTKFISFLGFLIFSINVNAIEIIPRVGLAAGIAWQEDNIAAAHDSAKGLSSVTGLNGGVVFVLKDNYLDLSIDTLKYDVGVYPGPDKNMPNSGIRSETNATYGHRLFENTFLIAGARNVTWGNSVLKDDGASMNGLFVGMSLSNFEWDETLFSFSAGIISGKFETPEGTADAEGFLMRTSWRDKDSRNLWSIKWSQVGTLINDIPLTVGYSYLFY